MWSDSPRVDQALGWQGRKPSLRSWLETKGFLREGEAKPERPKEAIQEALRVVKRPRSAARYKEIAAKVSFKRCIDPSFEKFRRTLQTWFPPGQAGPAPG